MSCGSYFNLVMRCAVKYDEKKVGVGCDRIG
jgi:hypothetical protein